MNWVILWGVQKRNVFRQQFEGVRSCDSKHQPPYLWLFILPGTTIGFISMLIFRMAIHQRKFKGSGAGSYLTYATNPFHFALYAIGYFLGFAGYFFSKGARVAGFHAQSHAPKRASPKRAFGV